MQISIEVTDEVRREAEQRDLPVIDYIELLIQKGRQATSGQGRQETSDGSALSSAVDRIRALRVGGPSGR